jgi:nucleotide-binding universal stress UspA family protein
MYQVLLAIDENEHRAERATEAVVDLPCSDDAVEVTVLNVFEEFEVRQESTVCSEDLSDPEDSPESVDRAVEILEAADVADETRRNHGEPATAIVEVAADLDADGIAMSGRKRRPTGTVIFGSVTQSVLLSASRPVHVAIQGEGDRGRPTVPSGRSRPPTRRRSSGRPA